QAGKSGKDLTEPLSDFRQSRIFLLRVAIFVLIGGGKAAILGNIGVFPGMAFVIPGGAPFLHFNILQRHET
ncbi:MAG: hypothetical protein Q4F30_10765, partial [Akkermansia sp.]|nr:hypothetical protein [Akkermansia sp.]